MARAKTPIAEMRRTGEEFAKNLSLLSVGFSDGPNTVRMPYLRTTGSGTKSRLTHGFNEHPARSQMLAGSLL